MTVKKTFLRFFIVLGIFLGLGIITSKLIGDNEIYRYLGESILIAPISIISLIMFGKKDLLKFEWKSFFKGLLLATPIIALTIYSMATHISTWSSLGEGFNKELILWAFALFLGAGIGEELVCRLIGAELFRQTFGNTKKGVFTAILLSSLFFGLCHLVNIITFGNDVFSTIIQVIYATGFGFFFSAVYFKSRNIWACVVTHWLFDVSGFSVTSPFGIENELLANIILAVVFLVSGVVLALVYLSNYEFDEEENLKAAIA